MRSGLLALVLVLAAPPATGRADAPGSGKPALGTCTAQLDARGVRYRPARRRGIAHAVEITGPLGGITYTSWGQPLVIDCSLAVSLDEAGRYLKALGLDRAKFSSAYSRRNVRGTNRPSKHSYGLAIDVHAFSGPNLAAPTIDPDARPAGAADEVDASRRLTLSIRRDYEQGLGDEIDCVGRPLTQGGAILKVLQCQLVRSGLFYLVLSPDYDDAHHDHFHLEVKPWAARTALRSPALAIH